MLSNYYKTITFAKLQTMQRLRLYICNKLILKSQQIHINSSSTEK